LPVIDSIAETPPEINTYFYCNNNDRMCVCLGIVSEITFGI